ncbi:hydroxysqualene dehydroxylase HpnE [Paralcaligenes ureilyticus]|uniref:Squalene-associated FAD-dependent desaturase n=1 Tax=Paralcaligenes ureilyticus TaxID=627131 RepID=A0A4R3LW85_9BURK|nr:hydroxysqualene dehydroxylase HpnE [Paralcaligenes ureilyticus]TCT04881.1 squalene-associated FAD-dependent desaturase [Paralcaligenes ureilyticus]
MKIAVIGAGWAGLSAAIYLQRSGHQPVVFEAARTLGGRARSVQSPPLNATIDNGQHILLGAYTETWALMRELQIPLESRLQRLRLSLQAADGSFRLKAALLPAPLHLLGGILVARGLSVTERVRLITLMQNLRDRGWVVPASATVGDWLRAGRQSDSVVRRFWRPLCLATLNTPIEQACAQLLANVLRDSLGGARGACDIMLPRVRLSELWPTRAAEKLDLRYGQAVRHLNRLSTHVEVEGERFDAALIATNAPSALRLLKHDAPSSAGDAYLTQLAALRYNPIVTVTLELERAWKPPAPMLMLYDYPEKCQFGQWLFDGSVAENPSKKIPGPGPTRTNPRIEGQRSMLTVVISDARSLEQHAQADIVAGILEQMREQIQGFPALPPVRGHATIIEKRATFAATPDLARPENATPWPRVWIAGDYTDTGYPAVLEGAVRSGKRAAELIAAYFS